MEDEDIVLVENNEDDTHECIDEVKKMLEESNKLLKDILSVKQNKEIFFLPPDSIWPFSSIKIPVPPEESYSNHSLEIIDLVKRALALMTPYDQAKCVKINHKKERKILENYVNKLYNMEISK